MSFELRVDLDQLDDVVAHLASLSDFLTGHLTELNNRVATLTGGSWESTAASAYSDAHARWAASTQEFIDGVSTMRDAAKNAHSNYTTAISQNAWLLNNKQ